MLIHKTQAQAPANSVHLLQPLGSSEYAAPTTLRTYVNDLFPIFLGAAVALAVIMITWGGMEYILSQVPGAKGEGKQKIKSAFWGLLIALSAWIILNTINPAILDGAFLGNS